MEGSTEDATRRIEVPAATPDGITANLGAPPRLPAPPRRIDRFTVLERVGAGGVGVVYSAYDPRLDRRVALKLLRPLSAEDEPVEDVQARFVREAQAMARLQHENVVSVYDVGVVGDEVFLVLELVEGRSLREHLAQNELGWDAILDLYVAAGRGLAAAHAAGLVHRDFKPANVLVGDDGRVRVSDFGIARLRERGPESEEIPYIEPFETQKGRAFGTPAYMAPEQHLREEVDAAADQFACCVSLYESLFGERPFRWQRPEHLLEAVVEGRRRPCPTDTPVPARIRKAIDRGLSLERRDRFASMESLLEVLEGGTRRRGPVVALVVGGLAAAMALGGFVFAGEDPGARCEADASRLEAVWNEPRRSALAEAFEAADGTVGPVTWQRVEPLLDGYANSWSARAREVCEATEVEGAQSREVMHLRMFCLEQQALALEGYLRALDSPSRTTLVRAIDGALDLPPLEDCSSEAFEAQIAFAPDGPTQAAVTQLRARLADAAGLQRAGEYLGGSALAKEVVDEAEAIGYEAFEAEARLRLGSLLHYAGEYEASAVELRDASFLADATRMDHIAAEAKTINTHVVARHLAQLDEARDWAGHARAAIQRAEPLDEALLARLMLYEGGILSDEGDLDGAIAVQNEALELRQRVLGHDHPEVGFAHAELGSTHLRAGQVEAAQHHYERAQAIHLATLGEDHPELAPDHANLGKVALRLDQLKEARSQFERAIELYERMREDMYPDAGEVYGLLGSTLAQSGHPRKAERAFERAIEVLTGAHGELHPSVARVHLARARAAEQRGESERAREWAGRAMEIWNTRPESAGPDVEEARRLARPDAAPDDGEGA